MESLFIKPGSPIETALLDGLRERWKMSATKMGEAHSRWRKAEERFMLYVPKTEADRGRDLRREQGVPQYSTIIVPYSYGMVMTAYTYWASVFLSRTPIFQFAPRKSVGSQSVMALEALMDYQVQQGQMLPVLHAYLLDVAKYGIGIIEDSWEEDVTNVSYWETQAGMDGRDRRQLIVATVPRYSGNKLYNVRPYDFYPDPRVPLFRFRDGEFVCTYCEHGLWTLQQWGADGYYYNLDRLRDNGPAQRIMSAGDDVPNAIMPKSSGSRTSVREVLDAEAYGLMKFHIKIRPNDWGISSSKSYEMWTFVVSADFEVLVSARPQGLMHGQFPLAVGACEPDAYALVVRGFFDALEGVQNTIDWLVNSRYFNVRAALNSTIIVDPSRIMMNDLTNPPVPEKRIVRLKPEAYGTDPKLAVAQLTIPDMTQSNLNDTNVMHEFGQRATGISDALMGMVETGGRRSATEFRTTAAGGAGRLKSTAELNSAMSVAPLAQRMVQNSQQYYTGEDMFRIVGSGVNDLGQGQFIQVSPEMIAGFYDYVPVDGTLPIDRLAQAEMLQQLLTVGATVPQVIQQYDIPAMFAWIAKLTGLKEMESFKLQLPQQVQNAQINALSEGEAPPDNVVPMPNTVQSKAAP